MPDPMTMRAQGQQSRRANRRVALAAAGTAAAMLGLAYASVPLYDLFCRVTGFGGTTRIAAGLPERASDRQVTVRFDANVDRGLPWQFTPEVASVVVTVGEPTIVFYRATNTGAKRNAGTATFNVTPHMAGPIFNKTACFCFERQELAAGESMVFPVSFFLDPAMLDDPDLKHLGTITLSYSFFRSPDPPVKESAALPQ